ncbi:DUF3179 domain-containing (seleno)protein [Bacillus sp. DJP31]|uniref:DUF3179 domain-containing (seleno)protein n=1 Tax=Bacillus sp. DJP31 TaxID=3409789 RepID=UPI003BB55471
MNIYPRKNFIPQALPLPYRQTLPIPLQNIAQSWNTNWSKSTIPLTELQPVKRRDEIPSIDIPTFETINEAKNWLHPQEPVMVVEINGAARAYSLQLLIWHEIVNDVINSVPIAVTYCPLCNSAFVFSRWFNNGLLEFGTTGLLRNSNLVMYDRTTESLWQQFTGVSIARRIC